MRGIQPKLYIPASVKLTKDATLMLSRCFFHFNLTYINVSDYCLMHVLEIRKHIFQLEKHAYCLPNYTNVGFRSLGTTNPSN